MRKNMKPEIFSSW